MTTKSPNSRVPSAENSNETATTSVAGSSNISERSSTSTSVETPIVNVETPLEAKSGKEDEVVKAVGERAKEEETSEDKQRAEDARRAEERRIEEEKRIEEERRRAELAERERRLEEKERQIQEQISAQAAKGMHDMQQQMNLILEEGRQQLDQDREKMMRDMEAERERQRAALAQELQEMKAAYEKQHSATMRQEEAMRGYWGVRRQQEQQQQAGPVRQYTSQGLPQGWEKRLDKVTGRFYYIDHATKTTHWNPPTAMLQYQHQQQQQQQRDGQQQPQPSRPVTTVTPGPAQPPSTPPVAPPPQKPPTPQPQPKPVPTMSPPQPQSNPPRNLPTVDRNTKPTHLAKPQPQSVVSRPTVNRAVKPMPVELLRQKMLNLRPAHGGMVSHYIHYQTRKSFSVLQLVKRVFCSCRELV